MNAVGTTAIAIALYVVIAIGVLLIVCWFESRIKRKRVNDDDLGGMFCLSMIWPVSIWFIGFYVIATLLWRFVVWFRDKVGVYK